MFDIYHRECPRCGATVEGERAQCRSCHHILPRRYSRRRRIAEDVLAGVLLCSLVAAYAVRTLRAPPPVAASSAEAWSGPGAEPAARPWAVRIEGSLKSVCASTQAHFASRKVVLSSLERRLGLLPMTRQMPIGPGLPLPFRFTAEETDEALSLLADRDRFLGQCLVQAYQAIAPCERYKADLGGADASACMVPRVMRALASAPYAWCAGEAKQERVRLTCEQAAREADRLAPKG